MIFDLGGCRRWGWVGEATHNLMEEFEEAAQGGGKQSLALGALENSFLVGGSGVELDIETRRIILEWKFKKEGTDITMRDDITNNSKGSQLDPLASTFLGLDDNRICGSGVWKTLDSVSYYINALEPALVNGFLHWISPLYYNSIEKIIVSFDIKDEVFHEILMPKGFNYDDYEMQAGELGGSLCIFGRLYEWEVEVWVMKEYGVVGSWTKLYKVGRAEIEGEFFYLEPLGVANSGEIIAWKNGLELLLYNPKTNLIRTLEKFGVRFSKAYTFIGSLVSPKVINGVTLSDTLRI
ncbi:hypothetical protein IFM89_001521 [Coptis chinensis]|uniref:F-box associated beta-propeller type 3 domain-containing protein n=1 Tax=Coptis chinensis TaxID=261450 RepID=A0A835HX64_9MAGN|nr:hypothetical protein IFM89_001521 [Coptis chinensis]